MLENSIYSICKAIKDTKNLTEQANSVVAGYKGVFFTFFPQIVKLTENCKVFLLQFLMDKHPCLKSYYTLVLPKIISLTKT